MCYELILSTTSDEDLSQYNREEIRFNQNVPDYLPVNRLLYPNQWYVGSRTGCSCSFRHLYEPDLGFSIPEDWFPEEESDIEATQIFVRLVRSLLAKGENVDCIDSWHGNKEPFPPMSVNLGQIQDGEFRFFENYHFDFSINT
ncbi:MAG: hypothetical protein L0287_00475 [Anaerolineae bacterium]|nr:hypothetical protein [Anaerolineae bacterium]MCI0608838.1 hypothetical protein [Anaerolineae bacterium]